MTELEVTHKKNLKAQQSELEVESNSEVFFFFWQGLPELCCVTSP